MSDDDTTDHTQTVYRDRESSTDPGDSVMDSISVPITILENLAAALVVYGIWLITESKGLTIIAVGVWLFLQTLALSFHYKEAQQ